MRVLFILLISILFLKSSAQQSKGYTILGKLNGLKKGTWLYLVRNKDEGGPDTVQRVQTKNENFLFKGRIPYEGEAYFIKIDTVRTKYDHLIKGYIVLVLENKTIKIDGSVDQLDWKQISIKGSPSYDEYVLFKKTEDSLRDLQYRSGHITVDHLIDSIKKINALLGRASFNSTDDSLNYLQDAATIAHENAGNNIIIYRQNWILQHPNSLISGFLIKTNAKDISDIINGHNGLGPIGKKSKYGQLLKLIMERDEKTAIGSKAPNFSFSTPEGINLSLKDEVSKARVTIIDFWASWCMPCVKSIPNLKNIYQKFHDKGLNIISYSVDEKEEDWREAILKYQIPWTNVRETIKDFASNNYYVNALPKVILLDNEGKVIAKGLTDDELVKNLERLLGSDK